MMSIANEFKENTITSEGTSSPETSMSEDTALGS